MPLPLAAGLYGILLGLGFTTFVLTLAVWALAGISVASATCRSGLLIGLGFGRPRTAGRVDGAAATRRSASGWS